jgi:peptidylprolyl isomerase
MGTAVTTHYTGTLLDGTRFDSSIDRGEPAQFKTGQVIQGWNEALMDMTRGEKRTLIIPPDLGYGERGYPGVIPPSAYLVFEVELIDF